MELAVKIIFWVFYVILFLGTIRTYELTRERMQQTIFLQLLLFKSLKLEPTFDIFIIDPLIDKGGDD